MALDLNLLPIDNTQVGYSHTILKCDSNDYVLFDLLMALDSQSLKQPLTCFFS